MNLCFLAFSIQTTHLSDNNLCFPFHYGICCCLSSGLSFRNNRYSWSKPRCICMLQTLPISQFNIFSASIPENLTFTTAVSISTPSAPESVEPCYPTLFSLDFFARYPTSNLPTKLDNAEFSAAEATSASLQCNYHLEKFPWPAMQFTCCMQKKRLLCLSMMEKIVQITCTQRKKEWEIKEVIDFYDMNHWFAKYACVKSNIPKYQNGDFFQRIASICSIDRRDPEYCSA